MADHRHVPLASLPPAPRLNPRESLAAARAFAETMKTRHSIRDFSDEPVDRRIIEAAIEAAGRAPSGANHQPWFFAVCESPTVKRRIREAAEKEERAFYAGKAGEEWLDALAPIGTDWRKPYLETAPYLIVCFGRKRGGVEPGEDRKNYYVTESAGLACGILLTALHLAGLATLTHTPNPMRFLNEALERPATDRPLMIVVVGRPAAGATVPEHALRKKPLGEIMKVY